MKTRAGGELFVQQSMPAGHPAKIAFMHTGISVKRAATPQRRHSAGAKASDAAAHTDGLCGAPAGVPVYLRAPAAMSQPGDAIEREADDVADRVMRLPERAVPSHARETADNGIHAPNSVAGPPRRARVSAAAATAPTAVPPPTAAVLREPGKPLDADIRDTMEQRFQADFGGVRIHADAAAATSAQTIGAAAYTYGRDVVFNRGRYAPQGEAGQRLLAHELTHVLQQSASTPQLARQAADTGHSTAEHTPGVFLYSESLSPAGEWPRHAFLRVTTVDGDYLVELGRDPESGTSRTAAPLILPWEGRYALAPYRPHPGAIHRPTDPEADSRFEARILELARSFQATDPATGDYRGLPDYSVIGPNSNGYVRHLVESAGGSVDLDWSFPGESVTSPYADSPEEREARAARRREEHSYRYRR